ncbi:GYF domain [Dillenia turbinata]|uniref:GYF domain n=1 Tax=Dillenia turbinata TaxID=194707 RepID=A0AAN8W5B9_9MAGN
MAERINDSDARTHLSLNSPRQISIDMQGSDNPIPLSPQWLLPKPGENKLGVVTGENHTSPHLGHANRLDIKSPGNGEEIHDSQKKKDVYKPTLPDVESGRRDRWGDEERDTNSLFRRDRWREGEKDLGETRKTDRWTENSSARHFGESRRAPTERWTDSGNRETNFDQRRESKWNTRWGPDDKETEAMREKWADSSRDGDAPLDKALSHGKDEKEGDHYRPWRPSSSLSRGRLEPSHHQSLTPSKQVHMFTYGRGRGDNSPSTFSMGRGKISSSGGSMSGISAHSQSFGSVSDKLETGPGEPSPMRYSRTKLLDVFRMTDIRSYRKLLDGFVEVPSLTLEEPAEPQALCAPSSEELVILKGIDKGDIVSSGAPQVTKDASIGRNSTDFTQSRRPKLGSGEDLLYALDDYKDEAVDSVKGGYQNYREGSSHERPMHSYGSNPKMETVPGNQTFAGSKLNAEGLREGSFFFEKAGEAANHEPHIQGGSSVHLSTSWRSSSLAETSPGGSHGWRDKPTDVRPRNSDLGWSQPQKDLNKEWGNSLRDPLFSKNESSWKIVDDSNIKRQSSLVLDKEHEVRKILSQTSPEDMLLYYKDPQGKIQGPFPGSDIIGWFEAGYFGIDLQVRHASSSIDSPFLSLGVVMPHLKAKARPPPGFSAPKPSDIADATSRQSISNIGKLHTGLSEIDMIKNEMRHKHSSATEAESRFLESLMSGGVGGSPLEKFAFAEGMQGYIGNNSGGMPSLGVESGNNTPLLSQRISLERQKSLTNPYSFWPGRDGAPVVPKSEIVPESSPLHSKLLPPTVDNSLQLPQNADLMSALQGLSDRSSSGVNNGIGSWSNFPVHGGLDALQDKQNFSPQTAFGIQQPRLQPPNQSPLASMLGQSVDNQSGILALDKLLSSSAVQDPQMLSLLRQQYLLQLQSQVPPSAQQLLLWDKLLLVRQQQEQEEQQKLLHQQQELLSHILSGHQPHQRFAEPAYGPLQGAPVSSGNTPVDHSRSQPPLELFQKGSQTPIPNLQKERFSNYTNLPPQSSHDVSSAVSYEAPSDHLPPQILGTIAHQKSWSTALPEQIDDSEQSSLRASVVAVSSHPSESVEQLLQEQSRPPVMQKPGLISNLGAQALEQALENIPAMVRPDDSSNSEVSIISKSSELQGLPTTVPAAITSEGVISVPVEGNDVRVKRTSVEQPEIEREPSNDECPLVRESKSVEPREVKKASEKKSRKQKASKAQSSADQSKGASKSGSFQQSKQAETVDSIVTDAKEEAEITSEVLCGKSPPQIGVVTSGAASVEVNSQKTEVRPASNASRVDDEAMEVKSEPREVGSHSSHSTDKTSLHKAWKPAPGLKAKSLLEIQQEEQLKTQTEMAVSEIVNSVNSMNLVTPWAGAVVNSEPKPSREIHQDASSAVLNLVKPEICVNAKSKKSQLHDLLAEEVLAKYSEKELAAADKISNIPPMAGMTAESDLIDDGSFIEAKETKKGRKRSAKAKGAGAKAPGPMPPASPDLSTGSSLVEKGKSSRHVQQEKEVLPAVPSGPSLGDFVLWKGEPTNAAPMSVWSTDPGKVHKPTSLREIQKEQGKSTSSVQSQTSMPTPQKAQPIPVARASSHTWSVSGSSPSKAASPIQTNALLPSQSKYKIEDDLFWGPVAQSTQETKRTEFPLLANQGSRGTKSTPAKGSLGGSVSRQKSMGGRTADGYLSSSPAANQTSLKGKRDAMTKHSEAMDFRDWCESESFRLTGTKDTSFLEFCLKQSRSEAEILLVQNLGSFDPNHEFIEKFLNYMELLPADVLEIAFQCRNDQKVSGFGTGDMNSDSLDFGDFERDVAGASDGPTKGGGKKRGKKGKKVSPSVLGFNVVSNRIMMGEIQTVDD